MVGRAKPERLEPGISGEVVAPVVDALSLLGFDARAELPRVDASPGDVVPGAMADQLLETASRKLGVDGLGLELARHMPIGALGLLDYAFCTSATLGDALERMTRHYGIATQRVTAEVIEEGASSFLVFTRRKDLAHSRHWLEFSIAFMATRIRQTIDPGVGFDGPRFAHPAPEHTAAHDTFFGTRVRFDAPDDRLGFSRTLLDAPLRTASHALAVLLDTKIRELEPAPAADVFVERVKNAVGALLDQRDVQLDSVAARLHVTRRTLQRELNRRSLSHKEVLDDIRRQRASTLLGQALTVTEVAERLAYSEPSAFFRAYRRWTGTSPRARQL